MIFTSLDQICRRNLLEKGLPIHYYLQKLLNTSSCLRELNIDVLKVINTLVLPVDQTTFTVDLPDDFVDDVGVAIPVGDRLAPVAKFDSINPIRYHDDTTGAFISPPDAACVEQDNSSIFALGTSFFWYWNVTDYGEPTGGNFGTTGGAKQNGYKVVKERRQIQMTYAFTSPTIVLMYISDGQSASAATQVDVSAFASIQAYDDWKCSVNSSNKDSNEGRNYYNERRKLVARLNDMTVVDMRTIILNSFQATIKN